MSTFRKGVTTVQPPAPAAKPQPVGRQHSTVPQPVPRVGREPGKRMEVRHEYEPVKLAPEAPQILASDGTTIRRGVQQVKSQLVGADGNPVGEAAKPETPEVICPRCGDWRERSNMRLLMQGTEQDRQGRIYKASGMIIECVPCIRESYRNPMQGQHRWVPIPEAIRFDDKGHIVDTSNVRAEHHAAADVYYRRDVDVPAEARASLNEAQRVRLSQVPGRVGRVYGK